MAGAGYGLMRGVHIRADFIYRFWSDKTQATVDAVAYLMFFIPSMIFFTVVASQYWFLSYETGERLASMRSSSSGCRWRSSCPILFRAAHGSRS